MLKNFLRTSVLTLGAGLCVLATLQRESHATILENEFDTPSTVTTRDYLKYKDINNQEQTLWGSPWESSVEAKTKTFVGHPHPEVDFLSLKNEVIQKGGVPLQFGYSVTVDTKDLLGRSVSDTLNREASTIGGIEEIIKKPMRVFLGADLASVHID